MPSITGESAVTVLVVGDTEEVIETIEAAGHTVHRASAATVEEGDPSTIVTVGESALLAVARERPAAPILPLNTEIGPPVGDTTALTAVLAGECTEHTRPLLGVSVDGNPVASALKDVTLVTSEPARISEYAIDHDHERVSAFRADGVVVATPAGSRGYTAAAGGPWLSAAADAVCVVPIAPFHTRSTSWVLDTSPLALSVLRDEGAVSLLIDDTEYGAVDPDQQVRLGVEGHVRTLHP